MLFGTLNFWTSRGWPGQDSEIRAEGVVSVGGKTVTVVMTERMYGELAAYAAALSAKPRQRGKTREVSVEDALLLASMMYIDDYLCQQEAGQA